MVFLAQDGKSARLIATIVKTVLLLAYVACTAAVARADENLEYKIKAAYLYNFTKFIIWPEKNTASFNICIVGSDPFTSLLDSLEGKTAFDKPIRIQRYDNVKQAKDCHIAYFDKLDGSTDSSLPGVLTVATLNNTLTVGSQPSFAESGGMIGFVLEDEKIKLHINLKALKQKGLMISAKLIEVSTLVGGGEHE